MGAKLPIVWSIKRRWQKKKVKIVAMATQKENIKEKIYIEREIEREMTKLCIWDGIKSS